MSRADPGLLRYGPPIAIQPTCLDATHHARCRCGAPYPPAPTLDDVARLYAATHPTTPTR